MRSTSLNSIPAFPRHTTTACVAIAASGTAIFVPDNFSSLHSHLILSSVGASKSSATANVPTHSPETNLGNKSFLISSLAYLIITSVNKYTDDEKGTGANALPSSSATTHSSRCPKPSPSYSSGILIPVHPIATIFFHNSSSRPHLLSRTSRFLLREFSFSRNLRASD